MYRDDAFENLLLDMAKKRFAKHDAPVKPIREYKEYLDLMLELSSQKGNGHEYLGSELNGRNINLLSAQGINMEAATLTAAQQVDLQAAGLLPSSSAAAIKGERQASIMINGLSEFYEYGKENGNDYKYAMFNKPSKISAVGNVNIIAPNDSANSHLIINASEINSERGKIKLQSYGDILLRYNQEGFYSYHHGEYTTSSFWSKKHHSHTNIREEIRPSIVKMKGDKGIELKAGQNIAAYATEFDAPRGSINIAAGKALSLFAVDKVFREQNSSNSSRKFLSFIKVGSSSNKSTAYVNEMLPATLQAEKADTQSGWDTLLQGTIFKTSLEGATIQAGVGENARKDAKIILQGIKTTVQKEESSESNAVVWQSMAGSGSVVETLALPKFEGPTPPKLSAPGGYIVDIPKGQLKTEIEKLARQPEYAYLKQLQLSKDVNWNQVQLEYQKWDYKQEGLTGAGAAIIALALAAVTGGAGAGIATALSGTVVTGTSAAMANAAFLSLATQASISLVNNKGNLGKTFKELGRSSTVKNLATAVLTAGVADKIGATTALNNVSNTEWVNNLSVNLATAGSSAVISTAINGGSLQDSLESAILSALVQTAHGAAASKIKDLDNNYIAHKVAHAVAGCAAAAANKGKCQDGAIGAAVGEIVGEQLRNGRYVENIDTKEQANILSYSRLIAGTVVGLTGGDVNVAAEAAQTAVLNNTLAFDKIRKEVDDLKKEYFDSDGEVKTYIEMVGKAAVNAAFGAADGTLGTVDYGIDTLNAAVYCSSGWTPTLCGQARATLAPKNKAIVDSFQAGMNPDTYKAFAQTLALSAGGDKEAGTVVTTFLISSINKKPNVQVLKTYLAKPNVAAALANSQAARNASNINSHVAVESKVKVANVFNNSNTGLKLGSIEVKEMPKSANRANTTRVFDTAKISDVQLQKEVFAYAEKLGGGKLNSLPQAPGRWYIKTADGATINVRSKSSTPLSDGSKPRWTIEIIEDKQLNKLTIDDKLKREIKFK